MHNWLEFEYHCRERMADALRWAERERRAEAARRAARDRREEGAGRARRGGSHHPATLVLARGELLSIKVGRTGLTLLCVTGRAWATTDQARDDFVLLPGQSAAFPDRGTVVIEALRTATVRIDCLRQPQRVLSVLANASPRPRIAIFL